MSRYVDIAALTESVLADVSAKRVKTAAVETAPPRTDIYQAIKSAAEIIRQFNGTEVTHADLQKVAALPLMAAAPMMAAGAMGKPGISKVMGAGIGASLGTIGGPAGMMAGGYLGKRIGGALGNMGNKLTGPAAGAAKVSADLRHFADEIRKHGESTEITRLTKAAHMLTAAVGLKHLTMRLSK